MVKLRRQTLAFRLEIEFMLKKNFLQLISVLIICCSMSQASEKPVFHLPLTGSGSDIVKDIARAESKVDVSGAKWARNGNADCLDFDGVDDMVVSQLSYTNEDVTQITFSTWVFASELPKGEVGIIGESIGSCALTYYRDGSCYWYINDGANHTFSRLPNNKWVHIVGTFNGTTLRLYLDGELTAQRTSNVEKIKPLNKLFLGTIANDPKDLIKGTAGFFKGQIADARVYSNVLSDGEIKKLFEAGHLSRFKPKLIPVDPVRSKNHISKGELTVTVDGVGRTQISSGGKKCIIKSSFSFPGDKAGFSYLPANVKNIDWKPAIKKIGKTVMRGCFARLI